MYSIIYFIDSYRKMAALSVYMDNVKILLILKFITGNTKYKLGYVLKFNAKSVQKKKNLQSPNSLPVNHLAVVLLYLLWS
jgi:thioredoxin-related protein